MPQTPRLSIRPTSWTLGLVALASCSDPFHIDTTSQQQAGLEDCAASADWLPHTPPMDLFKPLPHPETECPFYRGGWQNFLIATQPDPQTGQPALQSYPTIDTVFQSSKPRPAQRSWLGDIRQAGGRQILIDQNHRSIYYGIHVNQAFADFVHTNHLETVDALKNHDPTLFFPSGVVEFKSAWQVVDTANPPSDLADYVTIRTTIPTLSQDPVTHRIVEDRNTPIDATVRLLALHVVFTLPGHPEFIWATFEHSAGTPDTKAADGMRNVAPVALVNPDPGDPYNLNDTTVLSPDGHVLYQGDTAANLGNQAIDDTQVTFDPVTQTFPGQQTSIYRMYPASKSNTIDPDEAISTLNHNVEALFAQAATDGTLHAADKRGHYRLVGAQWMDKPAYFTVNASLQNDATSPFATEPDFARHIREDGADSPLSILAGEDRLSSTAMESFTQGPASFPNCFTCHNTQAVSAKGVPYRSDDTTGIKLLDPSLLNVSHVLTEFVLEESQ